MEKATLTINEVLELKRSRGIACSYYEEIAMLQRGLVDYGLIVPGLGKRNVIRIYRAAFLKWLERVAPSIRQEAAG